MRLSTTNHSVTEQQKLWWAVVAQAVKGLVYIEGEEEARLISDIMFVIK